MDERDKPSIEEFLLRGNVQEAIKRNMKRIRSETTVTIGSAAQLFGFTENQLRDWEKNNLLTPLRPESGQKHYTQRQYSYEELEKLAIIRELLNARYAPSDIPQSIYELWKEIATQSHTIDENGEILEHKHIDVRVSSVEKQVFWRIFVSRILRLSLMLITENISEATLGMILPLQHTSAFTKGIKSDELPKLGRSLVGWLAQSGSFTTFIDTSPSFEYPSDFQVRFLEKELEYRSINPTLIVTQRKAQGFDPTQETTETVRRLLTLLHTYKHEWQTVFGQGMRDSFDPLMNFYSGGTAPDVILTSLANKVVELGKTASGDSCWRFCCILLPQDPMLPLSQRSLVVYAQSDGGSYRIGTTVFHPSSSLASLSIRAFQSGHVLYRSTIAGEDAASVYRELEEWKTGSAIAVPIGSEEGIPSAVMYVVSGSTQGFSQADIRVLRLISKIVEELIKSYDARHLISKRLTDLIQQPEVVDPAFRNFYSENEFVYDVAAILGSIEKRLTEKELRAKQDGYSLTTYYQQHPEKIAREQISFLAVDIDNHSMLATKYGDRATHNLSREVGLKIQGQFRAIVRKDESGKVYHIYADRYYILMDDIDRDQALIDALRLCNVLKGSYLIDARSDSAEQPTLPSGRLPITDVTVRVAMTSYKYAKLEEILRRYPSETAIAEIGAKISSTLDDVLRLGMDRGGDVVIAWDPEKSTFTSYKSEKEPQQIPSMQS
ncbi:MAG: hypothetical protein NVS4B12_14020 [Ktedonobacteraceae bacterium]